MGHAFGVEHRLARSDPELLVSDLEANLALEDVEDLVLGTVDVKRWRVAARRESLHHGNPVASLLAAHPDGDERVEEPELSVCGGSGQGSRSFSRDSELDLPYSETERLAAPDGDAPGERLNPPARAAI